MINRRKFVKASLVIMASTLIMDVKSANHLGKEGISENLMLPCKDKSVGRPYKGWKMGEMDIHHIYTGRGESNFMIMPDGTTMLVDAGDWDPKVDPKMCEQLPNASRRAGEWIARYIERVNPNKDKNWVDYLMISHYHNDHTGDTTIPGLKRKTGGADYILCGITEVGETIHFSHVFDRGWPDYNYPLPITDPDVINFRKYVKYQKEHFGMQQEAFKVGALNQIKLLREPNAYKDEFSIRNLSASGEIWQGKGMDTVKYYDLNPKNLEGWQNENTKSLSFRLDYGPFSYYAGGDMSALVMDADGKKIDLEEIVARVCGPVDVCKANHHGYLDAMSEGFVRNIKARDYIFPIWDHEHLQPTIINRIISPELYEGKRTMYFTNIPGVLSEKYKDEDWFSSVCKDYGHIVVKVLDHGKQYKIYVLGAENENMIIKAVYGPFDS